MAQRRPSTLTSVWIGVPAGHQVEKKASSPSVRLRRIRSPRVQVPLRVALAGAAIATPIPALGRSRGGYGTKACVIADGLGRAVAFILAPGQAHELPHAVPLL